MPNETVVTLGTTRNPLAERADYSKGSTKRSLLRRSRLPDRRTEFFTQYQHRIPYRGRLLGRAHGRVIEPAADVRVAVLVELDLPVGRAEVGFHVHLRKWQARGRVRHLHLAEGFDDLHVHRVRVVRHGLRLPRGRDFDEDVPLHEFFGQRDRRLRLARVEFDDLRRVGPDRGELAAGLLDERVPAEEQFDVHEVVVHRHFIQVRPRQVHGLALDGHAEGRVFRGGPGLLLGPVVGVGECGALALGLVERGHHGLEGILPAVHGVVRVLHRHGPGLGEVALGHGQSTRHRRRIAVSWRRDRRSPSRRSARPRRFGLAESGSASRPDDHHPTASADKRGCAAGGGTARIPAC